MKVHFLIFFLIFFKSSVSFSQIQIKYKIGEEIITNVDILNEKKYLIFLRPGLKKLPETEITKISTNSLIKEIIKKKELKKIFKDIEKKEYGEIKKNLFNFKKVKNENEFIELIKKNNISYEKILEKIKYEALWNELIFRKFNSLVKIDEKKLKEKLILKFSSDKKFEYNLSEILFEVEKNETFKNKYNQIIEFINLNDFKTAASKFSVSSSSNKGGDIGWVKETLLSDRLVKILKGTKKDELIKPIKYPNGYLIIKINEIREIKQSLNIDNELKESVNFERNKQLNQFSLLYYKKLKQNTTINEY
ncbi:hypothetical protein AKH19_03830 [Pelagibacteraceae bacterium GOM-A1]|nr:hypothetical protein AKH19_03830 [Pelagibacteraceae bacterium GOM-A1]